LPPSLLRLLPAVVTATETYPVFPHQNRDAMQAGPFEFSGAMTNPVHSCGFWVISPDINAQYRPKGRHHPLSDSIATVFQQPEILSYFIK
jgi:hypothetical protein